MKIWAISDSHCFENDYKVPSDIDVVIFCGDESNNRLSYINEHEFNNWFYWFANLNIKHKLYIPGNHSTYVYEHENYIKSLFLRNNIIWMHNEECIINGIKFYGCGMSPKYGNWVYMSDRGKINKYWNAIPDDTNVLMTHTPPKGIMDVTDEPKTNMYKLVGCSALRKRINNLTGLKLHCFGHIHDTREIINTGLLYRGGVYYTNCSGVTDREFRRGITYDGSIIEIF